MSQRLQQTQAMLAKHHRDGERFAEMMKKGFAERFDDDFWAEWAKWIAPVYSSKPVVLDLGAGPGMFMIHTCRLPTARWMQRWLR